MQNPELQRDYPELNQSKILVSWELHQLRQYVIYKLLLPKMFILNTCNYLHTNLNGMILSIYQKEGSKIVAVWSKCTHNVLFLLCYPNNQPHLMLYIGTTTTSNIKGVHRRRYVVTSFCYCCISVVVEDASFTPLPSLIVTIIDYLCSFSLPCRIQYCTLERLLADL